MHFTHRGPLHRPRLPYRTLGWSVALTALVATPLAPGMPRVVAASLGNTPRPSVALTSLGAPVQFGQAQPDGITSFNATLPNGRRVTPAGASVEVGENPLNSVLTPDGKYLVVTNDDERNVGSTTTALLPNGHTVSDGRPNGAGNVPGGYTITTVRTRDMNVVTYTVPPVNPAPNPGANTPGRTQSDRTSALFLGLAVKAAASGGYTVYAAGGPSDVVYVYALSPAGLFTLSATVAIPAPHEPTVPNYGLAAPSGLALSPDGSRLYVVNNNANTVVTIDTATNAVVGAPVAVGYFPYTGAVSPNGSTLYVSNWGVSARTFTSGYRTSLVTDATGTITGTGAPTIGGVPGNLFASPVADPARSSSVSVIDLHTGTVRSSVSLAQTIDGVKVVGGTHPSALAFVTRNNRTILYVADANEDALALIDARTQTLLAKRRLPSPVQGSNGILGTTPNALAVSPDNTRLYVAEAGINAVAVYDVTRPVAPRYMGRIPTGWYPTGVTLSRDAEQLYVTNAKGLGSELHFPGAIPSSPDVNLLLGTVQKIPVTHLNLTKTTAQVRANLYQVLRAAQRSVLTTIRPQIQHVIYILRENKTYDTYLGNDATLNARGANGADGYANYAAYVPNTKALAEQFAVGDNVYADAEESNAGHQFALSGGTTDYTQKTLLSRFNRPLLNNKNEDPEDYPLTGYLFNNAARNGVSYRNYGDMLRVSGYDDGSNPNACLDDPFPGCTTSAYTYTNTTAPTVGLGGLYSENVPALAVLGTNHTDLNYPGWNLRISDQRRAREFIRTYGMAIAAGTAAQFTFVWLPQDHTGNVPGYPTMDPRFQVADNDAALGQVVDFLSHSAIWPHTAIFITEDDGQTSPDHVSPHRTYTVVVSPYAKRGTVVHRLSSTVSIPKTIEELLGLPPMNIGDLVANDLSDYFTTTPNLMPYTAHAQAPLPHLSLTVLRIANLTSRLNFSAPDRDTARLGQIDQLFFAAMQLDKKRRDLDPLRYQLAQNRLYHIARGIAGGDAEGD